MRTSSRRSWPSRTRSGSAGRSRRRFPTTSAGWSATELVAGLAACRCAVDDLVEVLAEAVAHEVAAAVLGHAFGDAGLQFLAIRRRAAIAQRDQRKDLALDLVALAAR